MAFVLSSLLFCALIFEPADGGYMITTPRRWTIGAGSQICASLVGGTFSEADLVQYKLKEATMNGSLPNRFMDLNFPIGESYGCVNVPVPVSEDRNVKLSISGSLNSESINETVDLAFVTQGERTFVSTDKYLYRPGQKVQFRILSVRGPNISVSTEPYEEIFVNNPSNIRIAQWNNVSNPAGLVHLAFDLYEEIEEGFYKIQVVFRDRPSEEKYFQVREFVLPRFEVVLEPTSVVLGSDENVTLSLCARYTFGEAVRGNATVYLASQGDSRVYVNLTQNKQIDGCENFTFLAEDLFLEHNNLHIQVQHLFPRAVVVEDGTGVEIFAKASIEFSRTAIRLKDISGPLVRKPYLPLILVVAATYADGRRTVREPMEVCTLYNDEKLKNVCKTFNTSSEGILHVIIPSNLPSGQIKVTSVNYPRIERFLNTVMEESSLYIDTSNYRQYMNPSNSSLTIVQVKLRCTTGENINFKIPVTYTSPGNITVDCNIQIASRGQVIATDKMRIQLSSRDLAIKDEFLLTALETPPEGVNVGFVEIPMTISVQSSPKLTILVWFGKDDGSLVADSLEAETPSCLSHKVSFGWSSPRVRPGEEATLMIKGASNSLCSIGVVDKSVEILSAGNNNNLNIATILPVVFNSEVDKDEYNQQNLEYCLQEYGYTIPDTETITGIDLSSITEPLHIFNDAGYAVISNLDIARRFCMELIMSARRRLRGEEYSTSFPDGEEFFARPVEEPILDPTSTSIPELEGSTTIQPEGPSESSESNRERNYLPETWLWLLQPLSAAGELNEAMTLPDTVTEWVGNAVCVHPTEGVGISNYSSIITFTPFFVDLTLPSSATRGEVLPITISIFNYLEDDLSVRVFVEPSADFTFVEGETGVRELCIKSTFKAVETVKVNLTRIGDVNITVDASSQPISAGCGSGSPPQKRDRLVRSLPVEAEGYLKEVTFTEYICTEDIKDPSIPVASWLIEIPDDIVMDSERAWITASGDLMAPTLENLGNLVMYPSGCGEQNMINFAPDVYILQYLDSSDQLTPALRTQIIEFLNQGYQTELSFRRFDGSYSAFGNSDSEGSTWLTAFVVKSFAQAKPYIMIDDAALQESVDWLRNLQEEDGCFQLRGFVIHRELQGGMAGSDSRVLLASYVLAAILEAGHKDHVTASAVQCLETEKSTHPYSLALRSYSLALANALSTEAVIVQLLALAESDTTTLHWILPGKDQGIGLQVETAAYALLGLITFNFDAYAKEALQIVRWISAQRNGQGGFVSTQDTVVALQALAAFEKLQSKGKIDLEISVSSSAVNHLFKITNENRLLQQRIDVPTLPTQVDIRVAGVGCALVQGVLRYNVLTDSKSEAFNLTVAVLDVPDEGCGGKTRNITVCTSYNLPNGSSNMAIIEFKLVTGYVANQQDLENIVGDKKGNFKRYEVDGQKVTLYLERITSEEICISLRAFPEIEIGDAKPGSVSVYDYYQPELITTQVLDLSSSNCPPE